MQRDVGLTFAGGGNRAFYELGLINRWGDRLWSRVGAIGACSAGACVATFALSGRSEQAHAFWMRRTEGVQRNFDPSAVLRGDPPAPHGSVYRDTCIHAYREGGLERIRNQPFPILVLAARLPVGWPPALASMLGLSAYSLEKSLNARMIHPRLGRRLGFTPFLMDARECETPEALADLILASSASPPFTPLGRVLDQPLLDGGMVDNVPAFIVEDVPGIQRNLVLLSRPYPAEVLGSKGRRLYVAPSKSVPIERWDYTRPELLGATIAMGEEEAERHLPSLDALLDTPPASDVAAPQPAAPLRT